MVQGVSPFQELLAVTINQFITLCSSHRLSSDTQSSNMIIEDDLDLSVLLSSAIGP